MLHLPHAAPPATSDPLHDWLTFASSVIGALAWPVIVLVLVVIFRRVLKKLVEAFIARIAHMTQMKLPGGIEGTFAEDLQKAADDLGQAEDSGQLPQVEAPESGITIPVQDDTGAPSPRSPSHDFDSRVGPHRSTSGRLDAQRPPAANLAAIEYIAAVSPSLAVVQAFLPVEVAARRLLEVFQVPANAPTMSSFLRAPFVPESLKLAARRLNDLRNRAAHEPDSTLTASAAIDFARTAEDVISQINNLLDESGPNGSTSSRLD